MVHINIQYIFGGEIQSIHLCICARGGIYTFNVHILRILCAYNKYLILPIYLVCKADYMNPHKF